MTNLLTAADGPACRFIRETGDLPLILLCDHAGNAVPAKLNKLGLCEADLLRHCAVDIGAAAVTERMAAMLGCAAVLCNFSRLVIDCNRRLDQASSITLQEDEIVVPGNCAITAEDRLARQTEIFHVYHRMVDTEIRRLEERFGGVCIIAIHSFTPQYRAMPLPRPWHIGVMWAHDAATAQPLLDYLRRHEELEVGDNEPYSIVPKDGKSVTYTMDHHVIAAGRRGVQIEIRNDEIVTPRGVERYATLLTDFFANWR